MSALWTSAELEKATGGKASHDFAVTGVAFDSREIGAGDLFLALKGEQSDGHLYVDQAFKQGAAGAIVSSPINQPHILVEDTTKALDDIAKASRGRADAKIIGVTGSAGKTGTKEALYAALERSSRGLAHRSVKSYNNHVGVPLSLSRMPQETRYGVFEMGMNHPGELSALTQLVRPHVAIVTTIAPAHIGFFKDEAEIAKAKAEIFEGLMPGGVALVPADNPHHDFLHSVASKYAGQVLSFGFAEGADIQAIDHIAYEDGGSTVTAKMMQGQLNYTISQPGNHWISNSLAVLGAVEAVGGDLAAAGLALAELGGMAGRGARHEINVVGGSAHLIDESYNSNPASAKATLEQLGNMQSHRRVAVLGTMGELGDKSAEYHEALGPVLAENKVDFALLVGEEMQILAKSLSQGVERDMKFAHCATAGDALTLLREEMQAGDAILIKGSNFLGLSEVVSALVAEGN